MTNGILEALTRVEEAAKVHNELTGRALQILEANLKVNRGILEMSAEIRRQLEASNQAQTDRTAAMLLMAEAVALEAHQVHGDRPQTLTSSDERQRPNGAAPAPSSNGTSKAVNGFVATARVVKQGEEKES